MFTLTVLAVVSTTLVNGFIFNNDCGKLSPTCVSENSVNTDEYLALSAAEKKTKIMDNVLSDTTPSDFYSGLDMIGIFRESMCPTFEAQGDELPWERKLLFHDYRGKFIHSVGVVGTVELQSVGSHPYTGVFTGSSNGIIRMSMASKPDPAENKTTPGIGLKFLRDGIDSGNLVAMFGVDGQPEWNFFKNNFSNHIPPLASAALVPLGMKFAEATKNIGQVGLSDMASYGEDGVKVDSPVFPFSLNFVPSSDVPSFPDEYVESFTDQLMTVPSGTELYKVYAKDGPTELGGTETHIANLVLTSSLTTSVWGDKHLFFRHQKMDDDVDLKPEWDQYLDKWTGLSGPGSCPGSSLAK